MQFWCKPFLLKADMAVFGPLVKYCEAKHQRLCCSHSNTFILVQVKEYDKKTSLGKLELPLNRLFNIPDMVLDQRFLLESSGATSEIKLKATLRVSHQFPSVCFSVSHRSQKCWITSSTSQQILSMEEKPKTTVTTPQKEPPTSQAKDDGGVSTNAAASSFARPLDKGTRKDPSTPRQSHPLASDSGKPSTPNMRRYDSRSLLSENSLASSRFDLLDGASYPE